MTAVQRKTGIERSMKQAEWPFYATVYAFIAIAVVVTLYPIWFVMIASFSSPSQVALGRVALLPVGFQTLSYQAVFRNPSIWTAYRNTIFYTSAGTLIQVSCTMTAAFVFSRKKLRGSHLCMMLILFTMYFSGGTIPTYFTIKSYGMLNTVWALLIPGAVNGYNLIIARTFIRSSIPEALDEAATIDGCSQIRYFVSIVLPLSTPILGVLSLYCAVGFWNSYMSALIYLRDRNMYPLQLILREILVNSQFSPEDIAAMEDPTSVMAAQDLAESIKYALIVVSTIPMLMLYPFLQKFFVKGVMIGAVKE